ncbi:MAG: hypothetical protein MK226_09395 [Saprospiraceae bacterium]|jgi:predicted nucleic acid-binding protein|nr:hypothetical protein [Saprospiraceae bacterium]
MRKQTNLIINERSTTVVSTAIHEELALCSSNIKKKPFLPKRNKKKVLKWLVRR